MPITEEIKKICCMEAKKNRLDKVLLMAVIEVESAGDPKAYRFEPAFWERYLKNNDDWKDRDAKEVSASYGLMQLMYTTAWGLGWRGDGPDLYEPVINIKLGAKLLHDLIKSIAKSPDNSLWPIDIALARYNGGYKNNPDPEGRLRNQGYLDKVKRIYWKLRTTEKDCD